MVLAAPYSRVVKISATLAVNQAHCTATLGISHKEVVPPASLTPPPLGPCFPRYTPKVVWKSRRRCARPKATPNGPCPVSFERRRC